MKPKDTRNLNPNIKDLNWKSLGGVLYASELFDKN